jgi:hypothetical protein
MRITLRYEWPPAYDLPPKWRFEAFIHCLPTSLINPQLWSDMMFLFCFMSNDKPDKAKIADIGQDRMLSR